MIRLLFDVSRPLPNWEEGFFKANGGEGERKRRSRVHTKQCSILNISNGLHLPPLRPTLLNQLLQRDATMTTLFISLPPLNPSTSMRVSRQNEDNDKAPPRPSIDTFEREPGRQTGLHLLLLHPTLLRPKWCTDAMRTLSISLPPLNPSASMRDFRQDEDNDNVPARPSIHPDSWGCELRDDVVDGLEDCIVLRRAHVVVDAVATNRWDPGRNLWLPVNAQAMVVDASNHSGWDPRRDFWRSLRHHEEAPTDGFSDCETIFPCPD